MHTPRTHPAALAAVFAALVAASALAQDQPKRSGGLKALWASARASLEKLNPDAQPGKGKSLVFGRVVDPAGNGIAGVGVVLGSLKSLEATAALRKPLARTDARGEFEFVFGAPKAAEAERRQYLLAVADGWLAVRMKMPTVSYAPPIDWRAPKNRTEKLGHAGLEILARVWGRAARPKPVGAEVPKIVLRKGRRLQGRVVDPAGKPVSGVRVIASDLLTQSRFSGITYTGKKYDYLSYATTGADGGFDLPGVFPTGSSVQLEKAGYFESRHPIIATGRPVTLTIERGGTVKGRVIGRDGKPAQASLQINYEVSRKSQTAKLGKDGTFEFQLKFPHRFRLRLNPSGTSAKEHGTTYSAIFSGPRQDLVITLDKKKAAKPKVSRTTGKPKPRGSKHGFAVSVVDRTSGLPLVDFKAASVWVSSYYADNEPYMRNRARSSAKKSKQPGYIRVKGPTSISSQYGGVVVLAKGYATEVVKIDWAEGLKRRLVAVMVPESVVAGVVRDKVTGKSINGASVRLYSYSADRRRSQSTNKTTDKDGRFKFDGLAAGYYRATVSYKKRTGNAHAIDLRAEEKRADVDFLVERNATVRGRITGMKIGPGWQAELLTEGNVRALLHNPGYRPSGTRVKLGRDGRFEFKEVKAGYYEVCVRIPQDPRKGGVMQIPLEPIRVRRHDLDLDIDASEDLPGKIRGKVVLSGAEIDPARLLVVAGSPSSRSPWSYSYRNNIDLSGSRCQVRADGSFDLEVPRGSHMLSVIDVLTGVTLYDTPIPVEVDTADTIERNLEVALTRVKVKLVAKEKGGSVAASWLDIDVELPQPEAFRMVMFFSGSNNRKPSGRSLVGYAGGAIDLVLPLYKTRLRVQSDVARLARTKNKPNSILGEHEFTPEAGKLNEVEIEVEVPDKGLDPEPDADSKGAGDKVKAKPAAEPAARPAKKVDGEVGSKPGADK